MRRSQFVTIAALAAAALGVGLWLILRAEPEAPIDIGPGAAPVTEEMDPVRKRMLEHEPWPYREFERDFGELRNPKDPQDINPEWETNLNEKKVYPTKISMHLKDATVPQVIDAFRQQLKAQDKDIRVFTYETNDLDDLRFTLNMDDQLARVVIDELRFQSNERFRYYVTSQGLVLGSERAVQQAQIDEREDVARRRSERDREDPMLAAMFRPDFSDAWIGAIHRSIKDQTGVEVVVDADTWKNGKQLTWHSDPVPLREALSVICRELHCAYRIHQKRIFLIRP